MVRTVLTGIVCAAIGAVVALWLVAGGSADGDVRVVQEFSKDIVLDGTRFPGQQQAIDTLEAIGRGEPHDYFPYELKILKCLADNPSNGTCVKNALEDIDR